MTCHFLARHSLYAVCKHVFFISPTGGGRRISIADHIGLGRASVSESRSREMTTHLWSMYVKLLQETVPALSLRKSHRGLISARDWPCSKAGDAGSCFWSCHSPPST